MTLNLLQNDYENVLYYSVWQQRPEIDRPTISRQALPRFRVRFSHQPHRQRTIVIRDTRLFLWSCSKGFLRLYIH